MVTPPASRSLVLEVEGRGKRGEGRVRGEEERRLVEDWGRIRGLNGTEELRTG